MFFFGPCLQTNPFFVSSMSWLDDLNVTLQSDRLRLFGCDETGQLTEEGESLRDRDDHIKLNHSFDSCFAAISCHLILFLMNY